MSTRESTKAISRREKVASKTANTTLPRKKAAIKPVASLQPKKSTTVVRAESAVKKRGGAVLKKVASANSLKSVKKQPLSLATSNTRSLLLLSPLRFPLDIDKVAIQTAKYAGTFMVVVGALLTLWHSTHVYSNVPPMSFMAQLIAPNYPFQNSIEPGAAPVVENLFEDTTAIFNFDPDEPIQGDSVRVKVELPGETTQTYLYARDTNTGATVDFGTFSSFSGRTAEMYIDVTDVSDGMYRFYAVATYESTQSGDYTITVTDTNRQEIAVVPNETEIVEEIASEADAEVVDETEEVVDESETEAEEAEVELAEEPADVDELEAEPEDVTNPKINISLPAQQISGMSELVVAVSGATYLEAYALQENTGTQRYIGLLKQFTPETWKLLVDTTDLPNGKYKFVVSVRTKYGFFTEKSDSVSVYNETVTITDAKTLEYQQKALGVMDQAITNTAVSNALSASETPEERVNQLVAAEGDEVTTDAGSELAEEFETFIEEHKQTLENALQILATAYRSGDIDQINAATEKISELVASFQIESSELSEYVEREIEKLTLRVTSDVETTNKIIAERTGVTAETDTDRDGITDFDEIVIYKTNPQVADSDGDGFTDGAEVLSGFDPANSAPQASVAYELPTERGIVRDDLLSVETITAEQIGETDTDSPVAILTGKGLPNSFVTLYIFSTPVVVTVRTDSDGAWIYRFDKELEDGEHHVYAGITDNAGKIVAKSNPLTFIKVAQAYEKVEAPAPGTITTDTPDNSETHSMISLILVTASISVVAIGLVLILLGVHLDGRKRKEVIKVAEST